MPLDTDDNAWRLHQTMLDWTSQVDQKASFSLASQSLAFVLLLNLADEGGVLEGIKGNARMAYVASLILLGLAFASAVMVLVPRLRWRKLRSESHENFVYFGHLRKWDAQALSNTLVQDRVRLVLARQCVNMAQILWRKHRLLQISLWATLASLLVAACTVGIWIWLK